MINEFTAHPNIALVKYWGKRDDRLRLPFTGSLSLTLRALRTRTRVRAISQGTRDRFVLGGVPRKGEPLARVSAFVDLFRELAGSNNAVLVESWNDFPESSGLASSASGFAALARACNHVFDLRLSDRELSILARRGSGSACRSIFDGLVLWSAGERADGLDSFAQRIEFPESPGLALLIAIVSEERKEISSTQAMELSVRSRGYERWIRTTEDYLERALEAAKSGDFTALGEVAESHSKLLHEMLESLDPPVIYRTNASRAVLSRVKELRAAGVEAYSTMDAGANVCVLLRGRDLETVEAEISGVEGVLRVIPSR
ncbi:MAG: diphosphomevalonate decarboxylase [Planctomycetes bacterium]|nr:diphosphomevalonate decarboxylase [Planctomycetota bacterium]